MVVVAEDAARQAAVKESLAAPIRVLVVDDHPAVRRGLRDLLEGQPDFVVVAAVSSADRAMSVAEREELDVAVVDYQLAGRNGLRVSRKLKRLSRPPRVVIYSAYCDGQLAAAAVVAEADALVSKGGLGSDLCDAIRIVAGGRTSLPVVPWQLAELIRHRLDDEEQAIFGMALAGITRTEIARILGVPDSDLEVRLGKMLAKLDSIGIDADRSGAR